MAINLGTINNNGLKLNKKKNNVSIANISEAKNNVDRSVLKAPKTITKAKDPFVLPTSNTKTITLPSVDGSIAPKQIINFDNNIKREDGAKILPKAKTGNNNSIAKTVLSGLNYIGQGAIKGAESLAEDLVELGTSKINPYYWFNPSKLDEHRKITQEFIKEDSTKRLIEDTLGGGKSFNKNVLDKNSAIKEENFAGDIARGIGNMGWSLATGNPASATAVMGLQAYGGGLEEAYQNNASRTQANLYALGNAGVEMATEWITGGVPGVKLLKGYGLDKLAEMGLSKVTNAVTQEILRAGYKMVGEGLEEALAEAINPYLKNATFSKNEKIDWENVLKSAISGAVLGGILDMPYTVRSVSYASQNSNLNIDTDSGLEDIEQSKKPLNFMKNIDVSQNNNIIQNNVETNSNIDTELQNNVNNLERLQDLRSKTLDTIKQKEIDKQITTLQSKINELQANNIQTGTNTIENIETPQISDEIKPNELDNSSFNLKDNNLSEASIDAKKTFGITDDFSKAGFIIENGEMLDFSNGYIQNEHSDIENVVGDMDNYIKNGAIRVGNKQETALLDIGKKPTNDQIYRIMDFVDTIIDKPLTIELKNNGNNITVRYSDNINSTKVKNDIMNYYNNNTIPTNVEILNNSAQVSKILSLKEQQDNLINDWIKNGFISNENDPKIEKWKKGYPSIFKEQPTISENINKLTRNKRNDPTIQELLDKGMNYSNLTNLSFENQVDLWKNDKWDYNTNLIMFKETPDLYLKLGLQKHPITVTPSKMNEIVNGNDNHIGIGIENVKQLPEQISNPLNIIESVTKDDSIVVITELSDPEGNIIVASMAIDGFGRLELVDINNKNIANKITANALSSAYGKNNYDAWIQRNQDKIIYDKDDGIIKKRIDGEWVQSPNDINSFDSIIPNEKQKVKLPTAITNNNMQNSKKNTQVLPTAKTSSDTRRSNLKPDEIGDKTRSWSKTITESDLDRNVIIEAMKGQDYTYVPQTNIQQWENAKDRFLTLGYDNSIKQFNSIFDGGKSFTANDLALGQKLLQEASRRKDIDTFKELLPKITIIGTELGQAVQSLSIIKKLSPEGQLKYLQATVDHMKAKNIKGAENINITNDMINKILGSQNEADLVKNMDKVKQEIAEQLPTTKKEKLIAWRYLSMLGNPRTHIRNIVSNTAMKGTMGIKNIIAKSIETAVNPLIKKVGQERAKTFKKTSKEVETFVKNYTTDAVDTLSNTSKYSMELELKKAKKVFGDKGLGGFVQKMYDLNSKGLELEDTLFKNSRFKSAMGEYLTANGIKTKKDIDNNPKLVNNAVMYATEESLKATFQQYNALASTLSQLKHKNAGAELFLDALMPFTKTPANILKTGASYSPAGLLKTIGYDTIRLKKGKITISQYIDNISQGLTGTGIMLLGYTLAQSGLLKAGGDDDKEGKFDEALGNQSYSINIGGQSFTLDWLSPVAMPLFVGAEISNMKENGVADTFNANTLTNMVTTTFDPLMQMSLLQGVNNALSGFKDNKLEAVLEETVKSYVGQLFPTLGGQIAKTIDPTIRSTSTSKDSGWTLGEQILRANMNKIPGLTYFLEPATDVWGNERQRSENIITRAFENFIAPYSRKEVNDSNVEKELKNIYSDTGKDSVIPTINLSKTITYKKNKYQTNAKEYTNLKKDYGKTAYDNLEKLFETNTYKTASENEKVKLIENVYNYAKDVAKKNYFDNKNIDYSNSTKDNQPIYKDNLITNVIKNDISYDSASYQEQNPKKYNTISSLGISYDKYSEYQKKVNEIKEKYLGTQNTDVRKSYIQKYINTLPYNSSQKTALYNLLGGYGIKENKEQMIRYIDSLKISKKEKQEIYDVLYK